MGRQYSWPIRSDCKQQQEAGVIKLHAWPLEYMDTLHIYIRGEHYSIDKHGCIFGGPNNVEKGCISGHEWKFLGVSKHHWSTHIDYDLYDIFQNPELAKGGLLWDRDHGTTRKWGGIYNGKLPRITSAWKE